MQAKSRSLRVLLMKNELLVRMLIMIIFLAPIGDWLVDHRFFLLVRSRAEKKKEGRKKNVTCFSLEAEEEEKKETTTSRKRIFSTSF